MKIFRLCSAVTFSFCLFVFVATAWSTGTAGTPEKVRGVIGEEAVITKIERDLVTLQSLTGDKKEIIISLKETGMLKVGDKVSVQGNSVKKLENMPDPIPQPETIRDPVQKAIDPKQPAASPDSIPKPEAQP
jgi:hypothetical protein